MPGKVTAKRFLRGQITMAWGLAAFLGGCAASPPVELHPDAAADATGTDGSENPGNGNSTEPPLPPTAQVPSNTMWLTIPVRGRGPANGQILLESDAAGSLTVPVDSSGAFCRDIPLEKGALNTVTLTAQDKDGNLSAPVDVEVQQTGDPPQQPSGSESQNIAPGGAPGTNERSAWGQPSNMIDGDPATAFVLQAPPFWSGWVWIDLRTRGKINLIRLRSVADCPLKHYAVFVSNVDNPGDPPKETSGSSANWIKVGEVTHGTGDDTVQFESRTARTMSIRFLDQDCGLLQAEEHKIREVEVWTEQPPASAIARAPSCYD